MSLGAYSLSEAAHVMGLDVIRRKSIRARCKFHDERPAYIRTAERRLPLCRECWDKVAAGNVEEMKIVRYLSPRDAGEIHIEPKRPGPKLRVSNYKPIGKAVIHASAGDFPFAETMDLAMELKGTTQSAMVEFDTPDKAKKFQKVLYRYQAPRRVRVKISVEGTKVWVKVRP
jgi:hypothetical protein